MATPATRLPRRRLAATAAVLTMTGVLAGCFTGERPDLAEGAATTGDPAADAVLSRLDATTDATFTAGYELLRKYGALTTPATVVQDGPARRSITIGSVRFILDGSSTATCTLDTGDCSGTIDAAMVSDTSLSPDFYASSAAARLRRDAELRAGSTTAFTETIAGQSATCVTIPMTGAESTYCALDGGPLARIEAADVAIELTSYTTEPDEALFARDG
jgi:hypothetical protein